MIAHSHTVIISAKPRRRFRLWIPMILVWLLLLPFVLLLAPIVFVACLVYEVEPFRGTWVYWQLFNSLRGVRVEVEDPESKIRIL